MNRFAPPLHDRVKRLCSAIERGDLDDTLFELDRFNGLLTTHVRETLRNIDVPVPSAAPSDSLVSAVAASAAAAAASAPVYAPTTPTVTFSPGPGSVSSKRSYSRRGLETRFVKTDAFCNVCQAPHPFEHWANGTTVSFACRNDKNSAISQLQRKCYLAIVAHHAIRLQTKIDFGAVGDLVRQAIESGVTNPVLVKIDVLGGWTLGNVRLVNK